MLQVLFHVTYIWTLSLLYYVQVVILVIIQTTRGSKVLSGLKLLKFFVIFQYVPRLIRIYPLFTNVTRTSCKLDESKFFKAAFNLLLYMVASHVSKKNIIHSLICKINFFFCKINIFFLFCLSFISKCLTRF